MRTAALVLLPGLLVMGCSEGKQISPDERQRMEAKLLESAAGDEVGRFQFYPANGEMPAMVFDTATGCMEFIERWNVDGKPKEIVWIRKRSDEVMEGTPKRCPNPSGVNQK